MKIYKVKRGILIEHKAEFYLVKSQNWDQFINDDNLFDKAASEIRKLSPIQNARELLSNEIQAPIQNQEVWASGVTYYDSKLGRQQESKDASGGSFYEHVYEAERPELFFKSPAHRVVGPGANVRIRKDSSWDVPEPELTLLISSNGKIIGYTIGNDMSSRSIEGENPLYLPQAKSYDGSTAIGPCIYAPEKPLPKGSKIQIEISRAGAIAFEGSVGIDQIKRSFKELVSFLYLECSFPVGCFLMTGTGIVPGIDFTLQSGDQIAITIDRIGSLVNTVA